ncbi:MAG TPA: hypothetical protein VIA62_17040 [Thermoanaerobaculia bacterium]|jgi:hypothetical protein|nr:hypothetical protein [Thermoanaerobaculia bacterium]
MLRAELRLLLKGQRWWWYAVAAGLIVAGFAVPEAGRRIVLPLAWIWPLLLWSSLGAREARFATDGLVFSAARPLRRQLPPPGSPACSWPWPRAAAWGSVSR